MSEAGGVGGYAFNVQTVGLTSDQLNQVVSPRDEQAAKFGSVAVMRNVIGPDTPQAPG